MATLKTLEDQLSSNARGLEETGISGQILDQLQNKAAESTAAKLQCPIITVGTTEGNTNSET
jgi:ketopantoate hydroxymethyltransferase